MEPLPISFPISDSVTRGRNTTLATPIRTKVDRNARRRARGRETRKLRFNAFDGESYTDPVSGDHRYVLLMDADGDYIERPDGLSTKECFDFLLARPSKRVNVAFGLNYDVNMMLRDFGRRRLQELWVWGETTWFDYRVEWIPGKWFSVKHVKTKKRVKVNEVLGFFQCSFMAALKKWGIETQDETMLTEMKASRSTFDDSMAEVIRTYCCTECELLVQLMEALRSALSDCGITLSSWNGAGSVAAAIFRQHNVKGHIHETPKPTVDPILRAYFGGRTELFQQGPLGDVYQYDIISAYPFAATCLPSLANGSWRSSGRTSPSGELSGIRLVEWKLPQSTILGPFPVRRTGGRISYPLSGKGWYHNVEVTAAQRIYGPNIVVSDGWDFIPADNAGGSPFAFVRELAEQKIEYKRQGHGGEKVLKLGINSLYGKLAQGKGYRDNRPPYQCYFWAGEITARTRARMLELASQAPEDVAMIATDGLFMRSKQSWDCHDVLGGLEETLIEDMFTCQPGVYHGYIDGKEIKKSRGFFAKEIDFEQIRAGFNLSDGGCYFIAHYDTTRFIGLGTSLASRDMDRWRTWHTGERKLVLYPTQKRAVHDTDTPVVRHFPPTGSTTELSLPYVPKTRGFLEDEKEYMSMKEQPLRSE